MGGVASRVASRTKRDQPQRNQEDKDDGLPKRAWMMDHKSTDASHDTSEQTGRIMDGSSSQTTMHTLLRRPGPIRTDPRQLSKTSLRSSIRASHRSSFDQQTLQQRRSFAPFADEVFVEDLEPNGVNVAPQNQSSRKNLRHIYKLCSEYEENGLGKERKRLRVRGVDVLFGKTPENDEQLDKSRNQAPVRDEQAAQVLSKVKLFKDLESQVPGFIDSLCQSVTFVRAIAGEVVCCQGDLAANAYVIARGEVSVHLLAQSEVTSRQNVAKWRLINMHRLKTFTEASGKKQASYKTLDGKGNYAAGADHGREIGRLGVGNVFGEVALLNRRPRGGTVLCATDCDFFVVEKKYFEHILRPMGLLSPLKFFQEVEKENRGALERIAQVAHFCDASAKQVIFRQGDPGEHCYVLVSGEVGVHVISPDFISPRRQHIETYELFVPDADEVPRKKTQRRFNAQRAHSAINRYRFRTLEGKGTFMKRSNFGPQIAVLGPGQMTGELALISKKPREVTIRCLTDCHFLVVRKDDFQRVLRPSLLLRQMSYFNELERKYAGIVDEISAVVSVIKAESGQVVFRQGDPPGHCYALVRGSVGVNVFRTQEEIDAQTPRGVWETDQTALETRYKTIDGLNTYSKKSNLGQQVTVLKDGVLIGESALLNDNPRMASLHCLEDCSFFAVKRPDFESIVENGEKKIKFLEGHLPFMPHVEKYTDSHPATCFEEVNVLPGKPFLTEGVAAEAAVYFVQEGIVEFCRCDLPSDTAPMDPMLEFSKRPISSSLRDAVHARSDVVDVLGPGGMFCTLAFIPLPAVDPFTIVSGEEKCRVYVADLEGIKRMPKKMLTVLRQQLAGELRDRLDRVREQYPGLLSDFPMNMLGSSVGLPSTFLDSSTSDVAAMSLSTSAKDKRSSAGNTGFFFSARKRPSRFPRRGSAHRGSHNAMSLEGRRSSGGKKASTREADEPELSAVEGV